MGNYHKGLVMIDDDLSNIEQTIKDRIKLNKDLELGKKLDLMLFFLGRL